MDIRKQRGIEMLHCNQPLHPSSADGGVLWLEKRRSNGRCACILHPRLLGPGTRHLTVVPCLLCRAAICVIKSMMRIDDSIGQQAWPTGLGQQAWANRLFYPKLQSEKQKTGTVAKMHTQIRIRTLRCITSPFMLYMLETVEGGEFL